MSWKWWKKQAKTKQGKEIDLQKNYYEKDFADPDIYKVKVNSFKEAAYVAKIFHEKKKIFINLNSLKKEERRRVLDFLIGTIYFIDGKVKKVKENIYYFQIKDDDE